MFRLKLRSLADGTGRLLVGIQYVLDQIDLKELRKQARATTHMAQGIQKRNFDAHQFKASQSAVEDVAMVASTPPASGESRKLAANTKASFRVVAVILNDRYEGQELSGLRNFLNPKSAMAVDRLKRWDTFKG